jgi:hypothetical protein
MLIKGMNTLFYTCCLEKIIQYLEPLSARHWIITDNFMLQ